MPTALTLRCPGPACRRNRAWGDQHFERLEATGRVRAVDRQTSALRCVRYSAEVRCLICGHVGWSKHDGVERLLRARGLRVAWLDGKPLTVRIEP